MPVQHRRYPPHGGSPANNRPFNPFTGSRGGAAAGARSSGRVMKYTDMRYQSPTATAPRGARGGYVTPAIMAVCVSLAMYVTYSFTLSQVSVVPASTKEDVSFKPPADPDSVLDGAKIEDLNVHDLHYPDPDFPNADYHDPDLHDPDLHDPDLHDPDLHDPDLHDIDLHDIDLHDPDLHDPDLHDPDLHDPEYHDPDLHDPEYHDPAYHDPEYNDLDHHDPDLHDPDMYGHDYDPHDPYGHAQEPPGGLPGDELPSPDGDPSHGADIHYGGDSGSDPNLPQSEENPALHDPYGHDQEPPGGLPGLPSSDGSVNTTSQDSSTHYGGSDPNSVESPADNHLDGVNHELEGPGYGYDPEHTHPEDHGGAYDSVPIVTSSNETDIVGENNQTALQVHNASTVETYGLHEHSTVMEEGTTHDHHTGNELIPLMDDTNRTHDRDGQNNSEPLSPPPPPPLSDETGRFGESNSSLQGEETTPAVDAAYTGLPPAIPSDEALTPLLGGTGNHSAELVADPVESVTGNVSDSQLPANPYASAPLSLPLNTSEPELKPELSDPDEGTHTHESAGNASAAGQLSNANQLAGGENHHVPPFNETHSQNGTNLDMHMENAGNTSDASALQNSLTSAVSGENLTTSQTPLEKFGNESEATQLHHPGEAIPSSSHPNDGLPGSEHVPQSGNTSEASGQRPVPPGPDQEAPAVNGTNEGVVPNPHEAPIPSGNTSNSELLSSQNVSDANVTGSLGTPEVLAGGSEQAGNTSAVAPLGDNTNDPLNQAVNPETTGDRNGLPQDPPEDAARVGATLGTSKTLLETPGNQSEAVQLQHLPASSNPNGGLPPPDSEHLPQTGNTSQASGQQLMPSGSSEETPAVNVTKEGLDANLHEALVPSGNTSNSELHATVSENRSSATAAAPLDPPESLGGSDVGLTDVSDRASNASSVVISGGNVKDADPSIQVEEPGAVGGREGLDVGNADEASLPHQHETSDASHDALDAVKDKSSNTPAWQE